jgi:hypothetical protein
MGVAEIVAETCCLDKRRGDAEVISKRSADLGHLDGMRNAVPQVVGRGRGEDLRLALKAAECAAVDDACPISFEGRAKVSGTLDLFLHVCTGGFSLVPPLVVFTRLRRHTAQPIRTEL